MTALSIRYETGMNTTSTSHHTLAGFLDPIHKCSYDRGGEKCDRAAYNGGKECKKHSDLTWYRSRLAQAVR